MELVEAVRERRLASPADRHPLGWVLRARRSEAQCLNTSTLLGDYDRGECDDAHRRAELLSLAYHRAVAQLLEDGIVRDEIVDPKELLCRVANLPLDRRHQDHARSLLESVIAKASKE